MKLGLDAPDSIRIFRGECLDAVDPSTPPPPPDFEAAAEHVVELCDATFADVDSMPPTLAEFYRSARTVVGSLSDAA